jgi:hypothetical protein
MGPEKESNQMNEQDGKVEDAVEPQSETSKRFGRLKDWAKHLVPVVVAVAGALSAYTGADQSAKAKASVAKDSAEAGYQGVDKWVHHLDATDEVLNQRIAKLEAEVAEIKRRARLTVTKRKAEGVGHPPAQTPVPPLPPPPPPLAPNLDKALEQIKQQQKPPEPAEPDKKP